MDEYLLSANVELRRNSLLREAEQARIGAELHEPHAWRHRMGEAFIRLGRRMTEKPARPTAAEPTRPMAGPRLQIVRGADDPRPRTA